MCRVEINCRKVKSEILIRDELLGVIFAVQEVPVGRRRSWAGEVPARRAVAIVGECRARVSFTVTHHELFLGGDTMGNTTDSCHPRGPHTLTRRVSKTGDEESQSLSAQSSHCVRG